jgi:hypothetical protein
MVAYAFKISCGIHPTLLRSFDISGLLKPVTTRRPNPLKESVTVLYRRRG